MQHLICIHGHFYQPPRENPWLEAVETQDSAHPYHDWNERITVECYEPNATARILDSQDRILRIVNNYASISFNFGPTLLSWLEKRARRTYARILDADRSSHEKFGGHGCAIAQAYNHMILPLANDRDKRTQVRWGVRDFEFRFGRKPEGMWLPETAVDVASLEALAAEGIDFTILEPHQVARFRLIGDTEWTVANGTVDPTMAYRCALPSGRSISIFLYDGPISRAVAFERLLARGETFAHRLVSAFSDERRHAQLVNIATDGETYGHHHRFGNMALAYAIQYIEDNDLANLTNYAQFLAANPPTHEVEIAENTSWSCVHGIERWRMDCGCSTGAEPGWNQRWRGPLRDALDWLRDRAAEIFEQKGAQLLAEPWAARDAYIDVVLDRSAANVERFLSAHTVGPEGTHAAGRPQLALQLLEMQRNAMLMYTSCGWFFNEISGIETLQILAYAERLIQLAEKVSGSSLQNEFAGRLQGAMSNIPENGTAKQIFERDIVPMRLDLSRAAAHYAVASLFDNFEDVERIYSYEVSRRDVAVVKAGRARLAIGSIVVRSLITLEEAPFDFAVLHLGETELTGGVCAARPESDYEVVKQELTAEAQPGGIPGIIRLLDAFFAESTLSIRSLFRDEQRRIFNLLCNATLREAESAFRQLHERYDPLMRFHTRLGIPVPKVLQMAAEFDLNVQLRSLMEQDTLPLAEIESRLREASDERVTLDETTLIAIQQAMERAAARLLDDPDDLQRLESCESFVSIVYAAQLPVDFRQTQNMYYALKGSARPKYAQDGHEPGSRQWLELFDALGEKLAVSPEAEAS